MKIKEKLMISIAFVNGEAKKVEKFYNENEFTHRQIYLEGIKSLKGKEE